MMTDKSMAVSRTARDALQAKWSAVSVAKYGVALNDQTNDIFVQMINAMAHHVGATKPQTPLVNAGYAMRIAVMLKNIQSFIDFHRAFSQALVDIQIVILGAGYDVVGFWLLSQMQEDDRVHLVEVDMHSVCQAKRDALTALSWVTTLEEPNEANHWQGISQVGSGQCQYSLVHADLRNISSLQESLSFLKVDRPVLVCSELVLAYLGQQHSDDLLRWCSTQLCRHPMSCLLAFEPLGSRTQESVLGGYQHNCVSQFSNKLNRGHADASKGPSFDSLGIDCASVVKRMHLTGWVCARVQLCGDAAVEATHFGADLDCREVFDEHAALVLHLQSYVMVLGLKEDSENLLKLFMYSTTLNQRPDACTLKDDTRVWLAEIEREDETEVRNLFTSAYQRHFSLYPAIQKMVKTALKKDLAISSGDDDDGISTIRHHYRGIGGHFLVAVQYPTANHVSTHARRVLGGIGWRKLSRKEQAGRGLQSIVYEVHRLVVAPHSRRLGVARSLLNRAEEMIQQATNYQLIASTPSFQVDATAFYRKSGFKLQSETDIGNILLQTYSKVVEVRDKDSSEL